MQTLRRPPAWACSYSHMCWDYWPLELVLHFPNCPALQGQLSCGWGGKQGCLKGLLGGSACGIQGTSRAPSEDLCPAGCTWGWALTESLAGSRLLALGPHLEGLPTAARELGSDWSSFLSVSRQHLKGSEGFLLLRNPLAWPKCRRSVCKLGSKMSLSAGPGPLCTVSPGWD